MQLISFLYPHMINLIMLKVKTFLHILKNSLIPHHPYYHKLLTTKLAFSVKYFIVLNLAAYYLFILLFTFKYQPVSFLSTLTGSFIKSLGSYPSHLVISIKNGNLHTNYDRPYFMWMDYKDSKILLFVIDENAFPEEIKQYNSIALITGKSVAIRDIGNHSYYTVTPLQNLTVTINKEGINQYTGLLQQYIQQILSFLPLFALVLFPLFIIAINSGMIALASALIFFIFRYRQSQVSYKKAFQLSLHSLTLPLLVNYIVALLFPTALNSTIVVTAHIGLLLLFSFAAIHEAYWKHPYKR